MTAQYAIGLDYGTNSVRSLIVDVRNGREVGTATWQYAHGPTAVNARAIADDQQPPW
jgi:L-ribulokinase